MPINRRNDENSPGDADAYYENVASQEEVYREETEEDLRAMLISEVPSTYGKPDTTCVDCCFVIESLDQRLSDAAEELITGDSDDPPLSEEAVLDMLRVSRFYRSYPQ